MDIKEISLAELDLVAPLFDAYRVFYRQPSDLAGAKAFLKERIENNETVIYMAVVDGKPAGFTHLFPLFSSVAMKRLWLLNDLFVAEEFRKKGIGAALMEKARQLAVGTGAAGVMLETEAANTTAQGLYEKLGFVKSKDFFYFLSTSDAATKVM
ncbi:GNAT family N-acetyltransferase [Flammeovirgaceae bacterium SG7u.111]|nr:GNAT family N-acetyltransferase [Flammeovirgaceae bacterium SG7u.132]WPO34688.1 GNAT family N-acetyltransferase [Flammeovirgaceae bacterium SG7u.111]